MKKLFKFLPIALLGFCLVLNSCSEEESINLTEGTTLQTKSSEIDLDPLKNAVNKYAQFVFDVHGNSERFDTNLMHSNLNELLASSYLQPIIKETLNMLPYYGISINELQEDISDLNDPRIALVGIGIITMEQGLTYAKADWGQVAGCALEAIGFSSVDLIKDAFERGSRIALRQLIRSVAMRVLGPIGVAIAVAEFAWCMR